MAWAINNNDVSVTITGVSKPELLLDSIKAVELLPKFTQDIRIELKRLSIINLISFSISKTGDLLHQEPESDGLKQLELSIIIHRIINY